jgi:hypothetical protein
MTERTTTSQVQRPQLLPAGVDGKQRTQLVVLLSLACLALSLFSLDQHLQLSDLDDEITHWREHAPVPTSSEAKQSTRHPQAEEPTEADSAEAETNQIGWLQKDREPTSLLLLQNESDLSESQLASFGQQLQQTLTTLEPMVYPRPGSTVRLVQFTTDASELRREWRAAPYAPVVELPLSPELLETDLQLEGLMRYQLGRGALHQAGGPGVPAWLMESLALFLERGKPSDSQREALRTGEWQPTQLRVGEDYDIETELALRSFAAHLIEEHGWDTLRALLAALTRGDSGPDALLAVLGAEAPELEERWLASLRGKYIP